MKLKNGSGIGVIGGGPAGSIYSYFVLDLAERAGLDITVDIYEDKDFSRPGPAGCNHCGGIVSESLVQMLASEGINLPPGVVQRSFDSYVLHMDVGSIKIDTPLEEKRIAAMFRGAGPLGSKGLERGSFDGFLQKLTVKKGANLINQRVSNIDFENGTPVIKTRKGVSKSYDLIVGATGLNPKSLNLFEELGFGFQPPKATKTHICEFELGTDVVQRYFGNSLHVFLTDLPRLEFAAIVPKGRYVTLVLLGSDIDKKLVQSLLMTDEMKKCFPPDIDLLKSLPCKCFPKMNIGAARRPFSDRIVLVGDCAVSKLYKNGIGAAYIAAKAAATTSILHGIDSDDFQKHYLPVCKSINFDNRLGKIIFAFAHQVQKRKSTKRGILRMIYREQPRDGIHRHMSTVLWDTFTGSAPYRDIFFRTLKPAFWATFIWKSIVGLFPYKIDDPMESASVKSHGLGKFYQDGENIITQGEEGETLYVIQSGTVEVLQEENGEEVHIAELHEGDFFGEMAVFERDVRSSTVRSKGDSRILTVDKKTLLGRIQEDPSLAFRILQKMSSRIREMDAQMSRIKGSDRRNWGTRSEKKPEA
jgi:CRP-like cAMP-binding protein/flavin-dependent dehydrogenase